MSFDFTIPDLDGDAACFVATIGFMPTLRNEMRYYGMLDDAEHPDGEPVCPCGILTRKLSSNDGWLVTPAEVEAALRSYEATPYRESPQPYEMTAADPESRTLRLLDAPLRVHTVPGHRLPAVEDAEDAEGQLWPPPLTHTEERIVLRREWCEWIGFLRLAALHGGFRVS